VCVRACVRACVCARARVCVVCGAHQKSFIEKKPSALLDLGQQGKNMLIRYPPPKPNIDLCC
jgi:hypothetical protein